MSAFAFFKIAQMVPNHGKGFTYKTSGHWVMGLYSERLFQETAETLLRCTKNEVFH